MKPWLHSVNVAAALSLRCQNQRINPFRHETLGWYK